MAKDKETKAKYKKAPKVDPLANPFAVDFIIFRALPDELLPDEWKKNGRPNEAEFLAAHGKSRKSYQLLQNIRKIEGFDAACLKELERYKQRFLIEGGKGLFTLIKGGKKTKTVKKGVMINGELTGATQTVEKTEETFLPSQAAIEFAYKLFGGYTDKVKVEHSFADDIAAAAELAEKEIKE